MSKGAILSSPSFGGRASRYPVGIPAAFLLFTVALAMAAPPSRAPPPGAGPPVLSPSAQKHVALFKDYYRHQLQLAPDDEAALYAALERPLPVTFRLVGALSEGFAAEEVAQLDAQLNATLVESAREAAAAGADAAAGAAGEDAERMALTRLKWYPHGAAWQLSAPKKRLKEARALQVALSLPPPQHPLSPPEFLRVYLV